MPSRRARSRSGGICTTAAQLFGHLSCIRERTMVHFNAAAQERYATLFHAFSPLEFMRLMRLAQWRSVAPAARLPRSGQDLARVMLIYNGAAEVRQANVNRRPLRDGAFVGETSFLRGRPAPADVTVTVPTCLVQWRSGAVAQSRSGQAAIAPPGDARESVDGVRSGPRQQAHGVRRSRARRARAGLGTTGTRN